VATPVPLPASAPTLPSGPAIAATRLPAPTILQSSTQVPTELPTRTPIAAAKSKKPLMIAGAALALLLVVGVAAYEIFNPTPHGNGGASLIRPSAQAVSPEVSTPSEATHAIDELPPTSGTNPPAAPKPKPERTPRQPARPKPSEPATDQGQQMYQKAQAAFAQKHYFEPTNDSALHWAILARQAGNPAGKALEDQTVSVYKTRVTQYYNSGNYQAALALVNEMLKFYPGNPALLKEQQKFQAALSSSNSKR
jgi:hypothetical protein